MMYILKDFDFDFPYRNEDCSECTVVEALKTQSTEITPDWIEIIVKLVRFELNALPSTVIEDNPPKDSTDWYVKNLKAILKALSEPVKNWKDKPDSEGWWWRISAVNNKMYCEYFDDVAVETWDFYGMGKFHKATVPEEGENEN